MTRRVLIIAHPGRSDLQQLVGVVATLMHEAGLQPVVPAPAALQHGLFGHDITVADPDVPARGCELVCVLGGDGTILRGAELARETDIPLLGVNFGHVGFLAEAEKEDLAVTVERISAEDYRVEDRMTLDVVVGAGSEVVAQSWALNEVTVEKAARERVLELILEIDGRPLSTWGCDGVVMATPTGSTAYAFSAGGPVVWPNVQATLLVPLSAHALFARPLVVAPDSQVVVELVPGIRGRGVMWCDGARPVDLPGGARVEVTRGDRPVRLVRLTEAPFTDRLVEKFDLSVEGWRGRRRS